MKEVTCNHCGDSVYLADRGERLEGYETPFEHFERTGHAWNEPKIRVCDDCDHLWPYKGSADKPTCPRCKGKRTRKAE